MEQSKTSKKTEKKESGPMSIDIFHEELKKWLKYIVDMMEGHLYIEQSIKTHIMDISIDYVIENNHGQFFYMFFHIYDLKDVESAIGKILTLAYSTDLIPNLRNLVVVGLVYKEELSGPVSESFNKIRNIEKIGFLISTIIEKVKSNDLIDQNFSKKISRDLIETTPYYSDEALPGEGWISDILDRRLSALRLIQSKIDPKPMVEYVFEDSILSGRTHQLLPRDDELRRWINPEEFLRSYGLKSGDVFIDVYCYEGLFTLAASRIVGESGLVYGLEISQASIDRLKLSVDQNHIKNVRLIEGLPEKVFVDNEVADFIFFGAVIPSLYNPLRSLENACSWLKDSGRVVILEWKEGVFIAGPPERLKLPRQRIIAYIEGAGLTIETIKDEGEYFYSIIAKKKILNA